MKFQFVLFTLMIFSSCLKEKVRENKLEGCTYILLSLIVDGTMIQANSAEFEFEDCNNRKALCLAKITPTEITSSNSIPAEFYWKFSNNGKTFSISNKTSSDGSTGSETIKLCYNISGTYEVKSFKKNGADKATMIKLESSTTYGFGNSKVEITLEKRN